MEGRSIIGVVGAAIAAAIGITSMAERNAAGEITAAGSVDAFEVHVGDCFDDGAFYAAGEVNELPGIPCSEPHDNQIYALFDISGEWPGQERVDELAEEGCLERFAAAIGKSYEESVIAFMTITPSVESWKQVDDREVICVGYHMDEEKLTGTLLGSGL